MKINNMFFKRKDKKSFIWCSMFKNYSTFKEMSFEKDNFKVNLYVKSIECQSFQIKTRSLKNHSKGNVLLYQTRSLISWFTDEISCYPHDRSYLYDGAHDDFPDGYITEDYELYRDYVEYYTFLFSKEHTDYFNNKKFTIYSVFYIHHADYRRLADGSYEVGLSIKFRIDPKDKNTVFQLIHLCKEEIYDNKENIQNQIIEELKWFTRDNHMNINKDRYMLFKTLSEILYHIDDFKGSWVRIWYYSTKKYYRKIDK